MAIRDKRVAPRSWSNMSSGLSLRRPASSDRHASPSRLTAHHKPRCDEHHLNRLDWRCRCTRPQKGVKQTCLVASGHATGATIRLPASSHRRPRSSMLRTHLSVATLRQWRDAASDDRQHGHRHRLRQDLRAWRSPARRDWRQRGTARAFGATHGLSGQTERDRYHRRASFVPILPSRRDAGKLARPELC